MKFHVFGPSKHGEEKSLSKNFFPYLSVHYGDFIEQIKKNLSYTLKDLKDLLVIPVSEKHVVWVLISLRTNEPFTIF